MIACDFNIFNSLFPVLFFASASLRWPLLPFLGATHLCRVSPLKLEPLVHPLGHEVDLDHRLLG